MFSVDSLSVICLMVGHYKLSKWSLLTQVGRMRKQTHPFWHKNKIQHIYLYPQESTITQNVHLTMSLASSHFLAGGVWILHFMKSSLKTWVALYFPSHSQWRRKKLFAPKGTGAKIYWNAKSQFHWQASNNEISEACISR